MKSSTGVVIDLQYLPCIEYFACLLKYQTIYIEVFENFQKQSYRNRCNILTASKVATLSVPVIKANRKQLIQEIKIDYSQKWMTDHWRTIISAYGKTPYFEHYADFFENILLKKYTFLFDLNNELLTACLYLIKLDKNILLTSSYKTSQELSQDDLRSKISPKVDFERNDIYKSVPYRQNFGNNFVSNLSIIDVLFCEGPHTLNIIRQSLIQ